MKLAPSRLRFLPALLLALPVVASAAVYKWTDEGGRTVFSNQPPSGKASNVQVVVEDDAKQAAQPEPQKDTQDRIKLLEQQVQALQAQAQAQAQAAAYAAYPPVQMAADYSSAPYSPAAYPPPPDYYGYPYPYAYPYGYVIVAPRRFVRPIHGFVRHPVGVHPMPVFHTGMHTGVFRSR